MKYFIDTEFIEGFKKPLFGKRRHFIDLISIGIYREDGKFLYLLSNEYKYNDADKWVKRNVILPAYKSYVSGDMRNKLDCSNFHKYLGYSNEQIKKQILDFFECWRDVHFYRAPDNIEVYGYYADYDWVLFCSLFGKMIDLPKGFPMYCRDLKQMLDEKAETFTSAELSKFEYPDATHNVLEYLDSSNKIVKVNHLKKHKDYPKQKNEHNALNDAQWNKSLYTFINTL